MDDSSKDAAQSESVLNGEAALAEWVPSREERSDMIQVAAYHIAERSGFTISQQSCWDAAEQQVELIFALRESKKKLQSLVDTSLDAVVMINSQGNIIGWNPQASQTFGWSQEEALGHSIETTIIPIRHRDAHSQGLRCFLTSGEGPYMNKRVETHAVHRDGHEFPVEISIASITTGGKVEFSAFIRDISERKRAEAELLQMATTDFLTGLDNRQHFIARITNELARLQRLDNPDIAILMLDLDHFKNINDTYGHAVGDAMLRHIAVLMKEEVRKIDAVGRIGGEEFAIVLPGASPDEARVFAERLRQKVATTPLKQDDQFISITVSIGITALWATDSTADTALIRADEALYRAKERGRNRVEVAAGKPRAA